MNYAKKVKRIIEDYELAGKLPMTAHALLKYRAIGPKTLAEFARQGHVLNHPKQWMVDINERFARRVGDSFDTVESLKAAMTDGRIKINADSTVDVDGHRVRYLSANLIRKVCQALGVRCPAIIRTAKQQHVIGARVMFCGHNGWFVADVYPVGGAMVIRANGHIMPEALIRGRNEEATHHVSDFPDGGFWRPDLGVLVVPCQQFKKLQY